MNQSSDPQSPGGMRWVHRVTCLLVAAVFPLIGVGNLVTTSDAGMAVPDWPNTYGYNLFLYPYREWFFGPWDLFVEHLHRLMGSLAGIISIALVILTYRFESRKWVRWLSWVVLVMVVFQGLLGGMRVLLDERILAQVHGSVGPLFFALCVALCVVCGRWWQQHARPWKIQPPLNRSRYLLRLGMILLAASYLQLVLGAFIRHIGVAASPSHFTWFVIAHVLNAALLVVGTAVQFCWTRQRIWRGTGIRASINCLVLLVFGQLALGAGTWVVKFGWPIWFENYPWAAGYVIADQSFGQMVVVSTHAAVGSLILAFWTVHVLRVWRMVPTSK